MPHLTLTITSDLPALRERLRLWQTVTLPDRRHAGLRLLTRRVLERVIELTPVDTAQARASWIASLEQLGGSPPPNWTGPHPLAAAVQTGRRQSRVTETELAGQSSIDVENAVPYAPYLEFGTTQTDPFAMVRRSLLELQADAARTLAQALQES